MTKTLTRRELVLENQEALARSSAVLAAMTQNFLADAALGGARSDDASEVASACFEASAAILNLLRYAGLSDAEILDIGAAADRERDALARLTHGSDR